MCSRPIFLSYSLFFSSMFNFFFFWDILYNTTHQGKNPFSLAGAQKKIKTCCSTIEVQCTKCTWLDISTLNWYIVWCLSRYLPRYHKPGWLWTSKKIIVYLIFSYHRSTFSNNIFIWSFQAIYQHYKNYNTLNWYIVCHCLMSFSVHTTVLP